MQNEIISMKIRIPILLLIIAALMVGVAFAEQITLSTYYPAPFGAYDRLQLVPRDTLADSECDDISEVGKMYVNKNDYNLKYCQDLAGTPQWGPLPTNWVKNAADIYPTDPTANVGVGIDPLTDLPLGPRFTIIGSGDDNTTSSLNVMDSNGKSLFFISDDGNIGIGTDSPYATLEIISEDGDIDLYAYGNSADGSDIDLSYAQGTSTLPLIVSDGDEVGSIDFNGYDGDEFLRTARISSQVYGTPGDNDMPGNLSFATSPDGGNLVFERMRIDPDGNVGIGTTGMVEKLQVFGNVVLEAPAGAGVTERYIRPFFPDTQAAPNASREIKFNSAGDVIVNASDELFFNSDSNNNGAGTNGQIVFARSRTGDTGGTEYMRITPAGNVGIGASSPQAKVQINNANAGTPDLHVLGEGLIILEENSLAGNKSSYFVFRDTDAGDTDWAMGVNNGALQFRDVEAGMPGVTQGEVTSGGVVRALTDFCVMGGQCVLADFHPPSDERLKKNITPARDSLEKMLQLHGVEFEWGDAPVSELMKSGRQSGFIAQEVEEVFPEWVYERADGYKAINYHGFEALTVEAIRELKGEIDFLRDQVNSLRGENAELKKKLKPTGQD